MSKHHSTTHGERYANKGKPTAEYSIWSGIKNKGMTFDQIKERAQALWVNDQTSLKKTKISTVQ